MLSDKEIQEYLKGVYSGAIDINNLPENLYLDIAEYLSGGVYEGFGGDVGSFSGKNLDLVKQLRDNTYMFSAAKTYQQTKHIQSLIFDADDNIKPFRSFLKDAKQVYNDYNVNYAETEYITAVASGQQGIRWNQIQERKEFMPYLQMTVVEDKRTTEICEPLDGITLPVDDKFWDKYYPPNHWRCRSSVLQMDEADVSTDAKVKKAVQHADEEMQDVFQMNVGKDGEVFSKKHPYFDIPKEDKKLAENNFNLPMPEKEF